MLFPRSAPEPRRAALLQRSGAGRVLGLLLCLVACGKESMPDVQITLEDVQPPAEMQRLDASVRSQFETLWRELQDARTQADDPDVSDAAKARADAWGSLGRWFDVYQFPERAARCYRNARELDASEPRWPYYLGRLATVAGDLDQARRHFAAAAELAPDETAPRVRLGDLALERQDLEQADSIYAEILEEHPDDPGALLGAGRLALLRGDGRAALTRLEVLAQQQPEASTVRYTLGLAWRLLGDEARAAEHFAAVPEENFEQQRLALDTPWDQELRQLNRGAQTLTRRGIKAARRGDHRRAAQLLAAAVVADPNTAETRINYALALHRTGRLRAALEQLESALRLAEPGSQLEAKAHLELGRLLASRRPEAAITHLEAVMKIVPDSMEARLELGRLELLRNRPEAALSHYAVARDDERPRPNAGFWHAALLSSLGRHDEARRAIEADLDRFGDDRALRLLLARVLSAAPDPKLRDLERAERLLSAGAHEPDVLYAETAAMVAAANGRFEEAVAWQEATIDVLEALPVRRVDHPARRRLALYLEGRPCSTPWETEERRLVTPPVTQPVGVPPLKAPEDFE